MYAYQWHTIRNDFFIYLFYYPGKVGRLKIVFNASTKSARIFPGTTIFNPFEIVVQLISDTNATYNR